MEENPPRYGGGGGRGNVYYYHHGVVGCWSEESACGGAPLTVDSQLKKRIRSTFFGRDPARPLRYKGNKMSAIFS